MGGPIVYSWRSYAGRDLGDDAEDCGVGLGVVCDRLILHRVAQVVQDVDLDQHPHVVERARHENLTRKHTPHQPWVQFVTSWTQLVAADKANRSLTQKKSPWEVGEIQYEARISPRLYGLQSSGSSRCSCAATLHDEESATKGQGSQELADARSATQQSSSPDARE
eukprot:3936216-Rhodomonas_salina.3